MAELVDALGSGSSVLMDVLVRFQSRAQRFFQVKNLFFTHISSPVRSSIQIITDVLGLGVAADYGYPGRTRPTGSPASLRLQSRARQRLSKGGLLHWGITRHYEYYLRL